MKLLQPFKLLILNAWIASYWRQKCAQKLIPIELILTPLFDCKQIIFSVYRCRCSISPQTRCQNICNLIYPAAHANKYKTNLNCSPKNREHVQLCISTRGGTGMEKQVRVEYRVSNEFQVWVGHGSTYNSTRKHFHHRQNDP